MTVTIPSEAITLLNVGEVLPYENIQEGEVESLVEALHGVYAQMGFQCAGLALETPWTTTSATYTTTDEGAGGIDLDVWQGIFVFQRITLASKYSVQFDMYAKDLDLRFSWERFDTRVTHSDAVQTGSKVISTTSGNGEWVVGTVDFDEADAYESGSTANDLAIFKVYVEGKESGAGTGYLWNFGLASERLTDGADIPAS
jgi:hypothetical protein